MGIYISGVKGLPEQVQENKNKIKEVEEQIEGIDFDAIRQLEEQVAENTQDINNLEASIGVQNQAINTLNNDVDALESKTQKITYDEDTGKTTIDSYTIINGNIDCDNVHLAGNGTCQNTKGSGLHFQEGANDDEVALVNKESGTAHDLTLHADGTLTLDGGPVGGKSLYAHYIRLEGTITMTIINDSATAFSRSTLMTYLMNKVAGNWVSAGGYAQNSGVDYPVLRLWASGTNQITLNVFDVSANAQTTKLMNVSSGGVGDQVVAI